VQLETPIDRIMTRGPVTVGPGARLSHARALLVEHRVHHLPVVKNGVLVGIVSSSDLRRYGPSELFSSAAIVDARLDCYLVAEVMTPEPVTVTADDPIRRAIELFQLDSFSALPVLDDARLIGIVTVADVLAFLRELADGRLSS
jgi:acetoin utilization protein AcuB